MADKKKNKYLNDDEEGDDDLKTNSKTKKIKKFGKKKNKFRKN